MNFLGFLRMYFYVSMISILNYIWEWYIIRFAIRDSPHLNLALASKNWRSFWSRIGLTGHLQRICWPCLPSSLRSAALWFGCHAWDTGTLGDVGGHCARFQPLLVTADTLCLQGTGWEGTHSYLPLEVSPEAHLSVSGLISSIV